MGKHSERHPVKEKHESSLQGGGTCASQGGSKKRMKVDTDEVQDRVSWIQGGSKKRKRVHKEEEEEEERVSRIRGGSKKPKRVHKEEDEEERVSRIQGGSKKRKRVHKEEEEEEEERVSSSSSEGDASQRKVKKRPHVVDPKEPWMSAIRMALTADKWMKRMLAKAALKFYEKSQGVKFEIVELLYFQSSILTPPGSRSDGKWCHSSFIAKPKYSDSSPEYFFAEFLQSERSCKFHVKYCSTFEPSDNPGFNHKCMFCPPLQKFHPDKGYYAGTKGWHVVEYAWV